MNKLLILTIVTLLLVGSVILVCNVHDNKIDNNLYQGPIPLGYDEQHFRKTGETIKIGDINGDKRLL